MDLNLTGKKALVCGSSQGIGLASAIELASLGAEIVLFARNEESLKKAVAKLPAQHGQKHDYLVADFSDTKAVKQTVSSYVESGNTIHILVNNTGGPPGGPITDADCAEFLTAFQNHLINNQNLAQLLLPGMKKPVSGASSTSFLLPLKSL
jgi:3-oxoacyl-[acyl-carrier protein] reductase